MTGNEATLAANGAKPAQLMSEPEPAADNESATRTWTTLIPHLTCAALKEQRKTGRRY